MNMKEDLLKFMLDGFNIFEKEAKELIEVINKFGVNTRRKMPRDKINVKNFLNDLSDFIAGGSPKDLKVYKTNKDGKLVEVVNNLELIRE